MEKKLKTIMSLSRVLTIAMIAVLAIAACASKIIADYIGITLMPNPTDWKVIVFTATIILCCIAAGISLIFVLKLLGNIEKGDIYGESNISILNKMAIIMFAIFGVCLVSGILVWTTIIVIGFVALYLGVIIKAVELCFIRANSMKEELDMTV